MIGIIAHEGETRFEFSPIFAGETWFDFSFRIPNFTTDDQVKEYGIAFSDYYRLWVISGNYTRNYDLRFWK